MPLPNQDNQFVITENEISTFKPPVDEFSIPKDNGYIMISSDEFEKMMEEKVNEKIKDILQLKETTNFKKINDSQAKKEISSLILEMKNSGICKINILDIVVNLNISPEQIERIMEKFGKEKKVIKVISYGGS